MGLPREPISAQSELEEGITGCWLLLDDLRLIAESADGKSKADVLNMISALANLYDIRFNKTFAAFESLLAEQHSNKPGIFSKDDLRKDLGSFATAVILEKGEDLGCWYDKYQQGTLLPYWGRAGSAIMSRTEDEEEAYVEAADLKLVEGMYIKVVQVPSEKLFTVYDNS